MNSDSDPEFDSLESINCHLQVPNFKDFDFSLKTFTFEGEFVEEDAYEIPVERIIAECEYPPYDGFTQHNMRSFLELKVNMQPMAEEPTILKEIMRKGDGAVLAGEGLVWVQYRLFFEDEVDPYESTTTPFHLDFANSGFPFFEICVQSMRVFEVARFLIPPALAYNSAYFVSTECTVPAGADIYAEFEVLKPQTIGKENTLVKSEIVYMADEERQKGNNFYKNGHYHHSIRNYDEALTLLSSTSQKTDDVIQLEATLHVNLANAHNKIGEYAEAIKHCLLALKADRNHVKALFHLGRAYRLAGKYDNAKETLLRGTKLCPNSSDFYEEIRKLDNLMKEV